ncbi:MAG TPA: methyltransferase domain-containing protein [Pyrinomonadaceae bacterium]|nr:methyltransferase domain-containing protein [Pyrinomonadaceae bacterium]
MSDTVERFSNRVENYVKYRPSYPSKILDLFRREMNLTEDSVFADIGSGTGISSKIFLENGNAVFGIEPNRAMREAAEMFLRDFPKFKSVDGTSENTNLADNSVDFVVAAQAFHWFDKEKTRPEFKRILRKKGFVALIWNERQLDTNDFLIEYENHLKKFGTDYEKVRHDKIDENILSDFFQTNIQMKTFLNIQTLDFEGLKGRMLSASYMPSEKDTLFAPMINELKSLFENHAENGKIQILYNTNIFFTRI